MQYQKKFEEIPSLASSSIPSTKFIFTTPPRVIFFPMETMTSKAAVLAFSDGSFMPRTVSGTSARMTCSDVGGNSLINDVSKVKRS